MSIIGILSSNSILQVALLSNTLQTQGSQSRTPKFEQIKTEFEQLGQGFAVRESEAGADRLRRVAGKFPGAKSN